MSGYTEEMIALIDAEVKPLIAERDALFDENARLSARIAQLEAELTLLSNKAGAAVVRYRAALQRLTDSFKYSTEVVTIAREALDVPSDHVQL